MQKMDSKEQIILEHYKRIIQAREFDEFDFQGFLITIRRHIKDDNNYRVLNDVADLIAHRERDRGIAKEAIGAAIANNYETITGSNEIQGYKGIDMKEWTKEWKTLFQELDINYSDELLLELTLCFYSLAQFTVYRKNKIKDGYDDYIGLLKLSAGANNMLALISTEGSNDSLHVAFSVAGPYEFVPGRSQFFYKKPVITERCAGKLRLKDEDGYII